MKALQCHVIINRVSTRKDQSLSVSLETPEMTAEDSVVLMQLANRELNMVLTPIGEAVSAVKEVRGQFEAKTPSARLRGILFVLWKQADGTGDYENFYRREMERIIDGVKARLEPSQNARPPF